MSLKALIIDRDESAANLLKARLDQSGHHTSVILGKQEAMDALATAAVDVVFIDPAPLKDARQMVIGIRRKLPTYTHLVLMGNELSLKDAMSAGANDVLTKPFVPSHINASVENAASLLGVQRRLNDPSEDYPSGGGVIAKSAFCQLFLSAIDRADRYGEQSYIMFISLRNYNQLRVNDSDIAADTAAATLAQQLVRIRRQSDILAQTGKHEYALLLQRPLYPTEPVDAALRFADTLTKSAELLRASKAPVEALVTLMAVPTGQIMARHEIVVSGNIS